jgi:hypothetical protein
LKEVYEIKSYYEKQISEIKDDSLRKDHEILKLKENSERKISDYEKMIIEEKKNITCDYEIKIEKILNQFEEMRDKMTKIIQDREIDIRNIIERNKEEIFDYQKENDQLKHEINCHKQNIISSIYFLKLNLVRNKTSNYEEEINKLNDVIDRLKKETKFQIAEIKLLDEQNNILVKDNVNIFVKFFYFILN